MKITRELVDNGRKIIHVKYEKKELEEIRKRNAEEAAKRNAEMTEAK